MKQHSLRPNQGQMHPNQRPMQWNQGQMHPNQRPMQWNQGQMHPNQRPIHPNQVHPNHHGQMHPGQFNQPHQITQPVQRPIAYSEQYQRQLVIEDAIRIARQQLDGEVVKAELEREFGRLYYEVDIIARNGRKYEVKVDATSGEVLDVELD